MKEIEEQAADDACQFDVDDIGENSLTSMSGDRLLSGLSESVGPAPNAYHELTSKHDENMTNMDMFMFSFLYKTIFIKHGISFKCSWNFIVRGAKPHLFLLDAEKGLQRPILLGTLLNLCTFTRSPFIHRMNFRPHKSGRGTKPSYWPHVVIHAQNSGNGQRAATTGCCRLEATLLDQNTSRMPRP